MSRQRHQYTINPYRGPPSAISGSGPTGRMAPPGGVDMDLPLGGSNSSASVTSADIISAHHRLLYINDNLDISPKTFQSCTRYHKVEGLINSVYPS